MKLKKMTACTLAAMALLGCAHRGPPSSYHFDYQATQNAEGVIRAFDDGQQTIVQFVDLERSKPMFADSEGKSLEYQVRGQYAVLPQIVPHLTVSTTAGAATFKYTGKPTTRTVPAATPTAAATEGVTGMVTETPPPAADAVANKAAELAQLDEQIKKAKQELADIQKEIESTRAGRDDHAQVQKRLDEVSAELGGIAKGLRVYFPSVGVAFQPDGKTAEALLTAARGAHRVMVVGHADNSGNRTKNDELALARAVAAKAYLVQHGIEAAKIMTTSKGDREPLATNATPQGRALNRRVDIAFQRRVSSTHRKD